MSYDPSFMNVEVSTRFALQQFGSINEFNNLRDKKKVIFDKIESFKQISNEKLYNDNDKVIKNAKEVNNENYILNIEKDNMNKKFLELKNIISKSNDVNSDAKKYFSNLNFDQYFQKEKEVMENISKCKDFLLDYLNIKKIQKKPNVSKLNIKFIFDDQQKYNKTFEFDYYDEMNKIIVNLLFNYSSFNNPGVYLSNGTEINFNKVRDNYIGDFFKDKNKEIHIRTK